jgi:hypothetical protein
MRHLHEIWTPELILLHEMVEAQWDWIVTVYLNLIAYLQRLQNCISSIALLLFLAYHFSLWIIRPRHCENFFILILF